MFGRVITGRVRRRARLIAIALAAFLFVGLLGGPIAAAADLNLLRLEKPDPVPTGEVAKQVSLKPDQAAQRPWKSPQGRLAGARHRDLLAP
ncbi:putative protein OS=Streptomyces microflavus OX=1919 GN=Smic_45670 PE=4 SV=1 [Streptomyces microflavus]